LLDFAVDHDVKKDRTYQSDGRRILQRCDKLRFILVDEEDGHQYLDREHDEALLKSEALLKRRATLRHVCANCKVVDVICEGQCLVQLEVLFSNYDLESGAFLQPDGLFIRAGCAVFT